jgi:hypothetical protein
MTWMEKVLGFRGASRAQHNSMLRLKMGCEGFTKAFTKQLFVAHTWAHGALSPNLIDGIGP